MHQIKSGIIVHTVVGMRQAGEKKMTDDRRGLATLRLKEEMSESLTDHLQVVPFYAFYWSFSLEKN